MDDLMSWNTLSIPYTIKHTVNNKQNGLERVHSVYYLEVIGGKILIRREAQLLIIVWSEVRIFLSHLRQNLR
jgi:hypothetical protein